MKEFYENRTRIHLPRRTYTLVRVDGKAFHTFTKGMAKPFDMNLIAAMDATAIALCKEIQGAKFAFVQSDEISIVITDFDMLDTQAYFDNNLQKIASITASCATATFNHFYANVPLADDEFRPTKLAMFDSRVFQIPQRQEVINYFIWRQQDTVRNSIASVAQTYFSHKELEGVDTDMMQEKLFQVHSINWNDFDAKLKRGRIIRKQTFQVPAQKEGEFATRSHWVSLEPPTFSKEQEYFEELLP